jgi:murein DD-endopeptidase MepM/ murein hydrolase activator NlpD
MRRTFSAVLLSLSFLALPTSASAQELAELGEVVLAERFPAAWLRADYEELPLLPARQRARMPRECRTRGGYREHCSGERILAAPHGPAAELARRLGLGLRATAMQMMHQRPLDEWLAAVADLDDDPRLTFPVPVGHVGRGFGYTRDDGLRHVQHDGVDIGAPEGAAIVAARDALVVYADNGVTGMGNVLILLHRDGASTLYAHCRALHVFAGQQVERGEVIAEVGETGFANAPHLHFEYRLRGWPRDPSRLFIPRERVPHAG